MHEELVTFPVCLVQKFASISIPQVSSTVSNTVLHSVRTLTDVREARSYSAAAVRPDREIRPAPLQLLLAALLPHARAVPNVGRVRVARPEPDARAVPDPSRIECARLLAPAGRVADRPGAVETAFRADARGDAHVACLAAARGVLDAGSGPDGAGGVRAGVFGGAGCRSRAGESRRKQLV